MAERPRTAWVTGATGTWGAAFVRSLLASGCDVVALGRREPVVPGRVAAGSQRRVAYVPLDLAGPIPPLDDIAAGSPLGGDPVPDVLIHAAVAFQGDRATLARTDYLGPADLIELVADAMTVRGSGRIGVLVGQNARLGLAGIGDVSAPQGALWTWAEALRERLRAGSSGVTLTMVIPPRAASAVQRHLAETTGHRPRLHEPDAGPLLRAVLAGRRRAGRRPILAAAALALR
jgi:NAD(P)-dependent dehydrogenase (short-subunit alcohol dehydrogenase family)